MKTIDNYPGYMITVDGVLYKEKPDKTLKEIKPYRHNSSSCNYLRVTLFVNGKRERKFIHQLVMLAYSGECPIGYEVNHIDSDSLNNNIDNLEYVTPQENLSHRDMRRY